MWDEGKTNAETYSTSLIAHHITNLIACNIFTQAPSLNNHFKHDD